jgi:glycosyltransferase involved in cell wall biosynthesis
MRIAFVSTVVSYPWGGADTLWTSAAEAAQARGDSLLIAVSPAVSEHPRVRALRQRGGAVHLFPQDSPPGLAVRVRNRVRALMKLRDPFLAALRRFEPDLVVFSCGSAYDLVAGPAVCDWLGETRVTYRIIVNWQTEHPSLSEDERPLAMAVFSGADFVGFVSTRNLEATRRHLLVPLPNARVLQNPLRWREEDTPPWPVESEWGMATVSRLESSKGIDLLLHAAARTLGAEPGWRLDVFGRGPADAHLRQTAESLGMAGRVHFRGHVQELFAIWAESQLMISPAIDEGVPMTIPEAMLCERPVLATAVGGAEDWIVHGQTGFICPAPTLPLLSASLAEAWNARDRWKAMGRAAAAQAQAHYRPNDHLLLIQPCPFVF